VTFLHLKLDELLRSAKSARNRLIKLEDCTDVEMEELLQQFEKLRDRTSRPPPENAD
jgi:low affinity Fe/Cu permease